ncbi:MAG: preprotein translocase subunit SecG [Oscillospiraceae bacterium]|nr:preprotein translocase subunit SecG [Oscillospiraceae bacterium]
MMIALSVIHMLAAVFLIAVILLQSGKSAGLSGALTGGGGDTFMSKNKGRSWDKRLARITKWVAIGFAAITLVINLVM